MHVFYLHGFTSSPNSKKGQWFKRKFAEHGFELHLPDLNVPSFEHLRMTAMLQKIQQEIAALPQGDVILIGSSLGGALAVNFADQRNFGATAQGERVRKLILLAPAFDLESNWRYRIGQAGIDQWRERGSIGVYNYAISGEAHVDYGYLEDSMQYNAHQARVDIPILDFHGTHDQTVPHRESERFAAVRPNVDLRLIETDHEMLDSTDILWSGITEFLGL